MSAADRIVNYHSVSHRQPSFPPSCQVCSPFSHPFSTPDNRSSSARSQPVSVFTPPHTHRFMRSPRFSRLVHQHAPNASTTVVSSDALSFAERSKEELGKITSKPQGHPPANLNLDHSLQVFTLISHLVSYMRSCFRPHPLCLLLHLYGSSRPT